MGAISNATRCQTLIFHSYHPTLSFELGDVVELGVVLLVSKHHVSVASTAQIHNVVIVCKCFIKIIYLEIKIIILDQYS